MMEMGKELEDNKAKEEVRRYWEGVYGMHENKIGGSMDRRNEREL